jgi:hypothetical protein
MVGSHHNHAEHGHTWQLVETPKHGGDKGVACDKTSWMHSPRPLSPSTHPPQTKLESHIKLN